MLALLYNQNCSTDDCSLSNWMSTSDHCTWEGISCDPISSHVTVINLTSGNLAGSLPYLKLDNLKYLTLPHNALTGAIPNFDMGNLEQMLLNDNNLENGIPAFSKMPNLLDMNLSNNNFSSIANLLSSCPLLVSITLTNNRHDRLTVYLNLCSASKNSNGDDFILNLTDTPNTCP